MKVKFTVLAYQKLKLYISGVDDEVSGLGYVKVSKDRQTLTVYDIILLPQESGPAATTLLHASIAKYLDNRMENNLPIGDIHVWWHSHGDMGASWSGVDEEAIEDFDTEHERRWLLSLVGDQTGEIIARLDIFYPFRVTIPDLEWDTELAASPELRKEIRKEIKEKVQDLPPFQIPFLGGKKKKKKKKKWPKKQRPKRPFFDENPNDPAVPGPIFNRNGRRIN